MKNNDKLKFATEKIEKRMNKGHTSFMDIDIATCSRANFNSTKRKSCKIIKNK